MAQRSRIPGDTKRNNARGGSEFQGMSQVKQANKACQ
jgi:hypothetical protein